MKKKIIIDCDNTFSVLGCDIDDGLAILYALAQEDVEVLGITTTFGNNELEVVHPNTISFMKDIGEAGIPVYKGAEKGEEGGQAANFILEMVHKYEGQLSILATGSLTNLYQAWRLDSSFYDKLDTIALMGGISQPLIINGKILNELNFSCNGEAALNVLEKGKKIRIATGNSCLDGFFEIGRFEELAQGNPFEQWLYKESLYWFNREKAVFDNQGIYLWDILAAVALLEPEKIQLEKLEISPDRESLKTGMLLGKGKKKEVEIARIQDKETYIEEVYQSFKKFGEKKPIF